MDNYLCFGPFDESKAGHPEKYFMERYATLDFRGALSIDPTAQFGFGDKIITYSHDVRRPGYSPYAVPKAVTIKANAWITSFATLYNCTIGEGSIVGIASVVANQVVAPNTVVAGNPAKVVARWVGERWKRTLYGTDRMVQALEVVLLEMKDTQHFANYTRLEAIQALEELLAEMKAVQDIDDED